MSAHTPIPPGWLKRQQDPSLRLTRPTRGGLTRVSEGRGRVRRICSEFAAKSSLRVLYAASPPDPSNATMRCECGDFSGVTACPSDGTTGGPASAALDILGAAPRRGLQEVKPLGVAN
jgi:hypothetical protein